MSSIGSSCLAMVIQRRGVVFCITMAAKDPLYMTSGPINRGLCHHTKLNDNKLQVRKKLEQSFQYDFVFQVKKERCFDGFGKLKAKKSLVWRHKMHHNKHELIC